MSISIRGYSKPVFFVDTYAYYPTNLSKVRKKHRIFKHR